MGEPGVFVLLSILCKLTLFCPRPFAHYPFVWHSWVQIILALTLFRDEICDWLVTVATFVVKWPLWSHDKSYVWLYTITSSPLFHAHGLFFKEVAAQRLNYRIKLVRWHRLISRTKAIGPCWRFWWIAQWLSYVFVLKFLVNRVMVIACWYSSTCSNCDDMISLVFNVILRKNNSCCRNDNKNTWRFPVIAHSYNG